MKFITRIKLFFKRLFHKKDEQNVTQSEHQDEANNIVEELDENVELEELEKFKVRNIVYEKLNYLEQYIKIFSLNFPNEYLHYLEIIQKERKEYEEELSKYSDGLLGELTFSIDPECESNRLIKISNLHEEITNFVDFVVTYNVYKDKFSKLCLKLNQFYNALLDTKRETSVVSSQLDNAIVSMHNLVIKVKEFNFFKKDTRKKEEILNYIIYGEYIFLKSSIRCGLAKDFDDYKINMSKFHNLFIDSEYDSMVLKFFIEDLELYQNYITANLKQDKMYNHILTCCQNLQNRLNNYQTVFKDSNFFLTLVKFENTVDNISENNGVEFIFPLPESIDSSSPCDQSISIKDTAISLLNMLESNKAKILYDIILNFKYEISWREFYFICRIFNLYDEVMKVSLNTIFSFVHTKFLKLNAKYVEYSDHFIESEKQKLLHYHGSKKKKYVFLLESDSSNLPVVVYELKELCLDFLVSGNNIYLNHSYFNGFKNLEKNFGQYKLLEDL